MPFVNAGTWLSTSSGQSWESSAINYTRRREIGVIVAIAVVPTVSPLTACKIDLGIDNALPQKSYLTLEPRYVLYESDVLYYSYRIGRPISNRGDLSVRIERFSVWRGSSNAGDITFDVQIDVGEV